MLNSSSKNMSEVYRVNYIDKTRKTSCDVVSSVFSTEVLFVAFRLNTQLKSNRKSNEKKKKQKQREERGSYVVWYLARHLQYFKTVGEPTALEINKEYKFGGQLFV